MNTLLDTLLVISMRLFDTESTIAPASSQCLRSCIRDAD